MRQTGYYVTLAVLCLLATLAVRCLGAEADTLSSPPMKGLRTTDPVVVDGVLKEPLWSSFPPYTVFHQSDPNQGKPPSELTEVWIAYDDEALYVAARMFDRNPDSIVTRLARRDVESYGDEFFFAIDPYHDGRSGFYFGVDAAGTRYDGIMYNDEWTDATWDGVWEGKTHRDSTGWTAEMRIPFSQLRFQSSDIYHWTVNCKRIIARKHENDLVVYTPKGGSGFVSRFVELEGIRDIPPPHHVEFLPYVTTKAEYLQHATGDPFNSGARYTPSVGLDMKLGLRSNLTLDATVNPDFGQVEVDPAVVNLSDVETYFNEKRPFFMEGSPVFEFGRGGARSYWNFNFPTPTLFYTRRIGRAPQGSVPDADYADVPNAARILGAAKLTGKIADSWNIGTIHAVTARTSADLQTNGTRTTAEVEPLTYYGIVRAQNEFDKGAEGLGFMSTLTSRHLDGSRLLDELNKTGAMMGVDGWTFLDTSKTWVATGYVAGSYVQGSTARMLDLQQNSLHYFQRPDAKAYHVDSNATSLTGYAGRFYLNKQKGDVLFNAALGVLDPRFDVNDLGFMYRTDIINGHVGVGYQWVEPTEWYRSADVIGALFRSYDFDGDIVWQGVFALTEITLPNYYYVSADWAYNPKTMNPRRTRGGPVTLNVRGYQYDLTISSDSRKELIFTLSGGTYTDNETSWSLYLGAEWHPAPAVSISIAPTLQRSADLAQYVGTFDDPTATATYGKRYVFGVLEQLNLSTDIRLNLTFTPEISLQLFVQPLISATRYGSFRELARPRTFDFNVYGTNGSTISLSDGTYTVDPDGAGPAQSFTFSDPAFNFKSLRGNAVFRWEYMPGSTLYLVWTQSRSMSDSYSDFALGPSIHQIANSVPDNVFMVKCSYWWNR